MWLDLLQIAVRLEDGCRVLLLVLRQKHAYYSSGRT